MAATLFCIVVGIVGVTSIVCVTIVTLKKISLRCKHQWNTVKEIEIANGDGTVIGYRYVQQCVHCGALQYIDCDGRR